MPLEIVVKLVKFSERKALPLLFDCDANAHNGIWRSSETN